MQAAAFSEDPERRAQHRGVVLWLGEVLSGAMNARYAAQAREKLGMTPEPDGIPEGSPYMDSDGLGGQELDA